jgi:hypothetical protein
MGDKHGAKKFAETTSRLASARARVSEPNASQIATIEDQIAAIGRGDFEAALSRASPDVELEIFAPRNSPSSPAHGAPKSCATPCSTTSDQSRINSR